MSKITFKITGSLNLLITYCLRREVPAQVTHHDLFPSNCSIYVFVAKLLLKIFEIFFG